MIVAPFLLICLWIGLIIFKTQPHTNSAQTYFVADKKTPLFGETDYMWYWAIYVIPGSFFIGISATVISVYLQKSKKSNPIYLEGHQHAKSV